MRPIFCVALSTFLHPFLASSYPLNQNFSKRASFPRNLTLQKLCQHFFHQITTSPLLSPNPKEKVVHHHAVMSSFTHLATSLVLPVYLLFIFFFDIESGRKNLTVFYSCHFSSCLASGLPLLPRALQRVTRDQSPHTHCVLCWHSRRDGSKTEDAGLRARFLSLRSRCTLRTFFNVAAYRQAGELCGW